MKLPRDLKPKPVDPRYPKFLSCERRTLISQSIYVGGIQSSVMAPGCKWEKRSELSISSEVPDVIYQERYFNFTWNYFLVGVVLYQQKVNIKCSN